MITVLGLASLLAAGPAAAQSPGATGHPEFTVEIVAGKGCPPEPLPAASRRTLYLQADAGAANKVGLVEGPFQVLDGVACDASGATLQLPASPYICPGYDEACDDPLVQKYDVMARLVGRPGAAMKIGACAFGPGPDGLMGTGDDIADCTADNYVEVRRAGTGGFHDAAKELTTVSVDVDGDGLLDRVNLFDSRLRDYFWTVDAEGRAHAQVFFVAVGK